MQLPLETTTSTFWLVIAIILMALTLIMMFIPRIPSCIVGYMAMWATRFSGYAFLSDGTMLFWGVAVVLVTVNRFLLPAYIRNSRRGLGYIVGGAIVGMALGLTLYRASSIIGGAVLGAFLGAVAYTRTSRGAILQFPTSKFFNYLGAKGIPAVIAASMVGLILSGFITAGATPLG